MKNFVCLFTMFVTTSRISFVIFCHNKWRRLLGVSEPQFFLTSFRMRFCLFFIVLLCFVWFYFLSFSLLPWIEVKHLARHNFGSCNHLGCNHLATTSSFLISSEFGFYCPKNLLLTALLWKRWNIDWIELSQIKVAFRAWMVFLFFIHVWRGRGIKRERKKERKKDR